MSTCGPGVSHAVIWKLINGQWDGLDLGLNLNTIQPSRTLSTDINERSEVLGIGFAQITGQSFIAMDLGAGEDAQLSGLGRHGASGSTMTANSLNNFGRVVGTFRRYIYLSEAEIVIPGQFPQKRPFLWQNGVFIDLNRLYGGSLPLDPPYSGIWWISTAIDINDNGQIVGQLAYNYAEEEPFYYDNYNNYTAFILNPQELISLESPEFDDDFTFTVTGPSGWNCTVEARQSMNTGSWQSIGAVYLFNGAGEFTDSGSSTLSQRFYRVKYGQAKSKNAVGFLTKTIPTGYSMLANPFWGADNRVEALFEGSNIPNQTLAQKYYNDIADFRDNTYSSGEWTYPEMTLDPGEGIILDSPSSWSVTFVGHILQGSKTKMLPTDLSIISTIVPAEGTMDEGFNLPLDSGDILYTMDSSGSYTVYTYISGESWVPSEPQIALGEAFWINKGLGSLWRQNYSLW